MKKTLIALAVLAAAGTASAQSSVVLFGIVDAAIAHGSGSTSNKTHLTNSGYNSSRLGFRGVEDMGGGMNAGFWLEAGLTNDDGTGAASNANNQTVAAFNAVTGANAPVRPGTQGLTFNRRSTVSLGGSWGELRLGRDYSPQFWNLTVFDPFGTNGVGTTQTLNSNIAGVTAVRASNAVTYLYGHAFNSTYTGGQGFHAAVQYYLGENNTGATTSKDGRGAGVRLGYAAGPFSVAFGYGRTTYFAGDTKQSNLAGSYDFGVAQLMAHYSSDSNGAVGAKGYLVGGLIPVGVGQIRIAYSRYRTDAATTPTSKKIAIGYVHNLSKRTSLYTTYARVNNSGAANSALNGATTAAGNSSSGYDFGIKHSF